MKVMKVMNNSLILAEDENKNEVIVMGKGLGFNSKAGDLLDPSKVAKIFVLKDDKASNDYVKLIENMPGEYVDITNFIISYANEKLNGKLNDQVFITLMDHISYALERYNKGITIQNRLLWEIKKFYPKEFEIAKYSVDYINEKLKVHLPDEEAGNIAFHLVNAQTDEQEMENTMLSVKMLKDIFNIVQYHFRITIDKETLNYSRFLTHLQFFVQRLLDGKLIESKNSFIFEQIVKQYPQEYKCAMLIRDYVKNLLGITISDEEMLYIIIHIVRIIN